MHTKNTGTSTFKISTKNLSFGVTAKEILQDVSLQVMENQMVGLIGPNGSGKTTLLKHIYRALPPEKKTVFINGKAIEKMSFRDTAKEVTVMRQENTSDFEYTILEMVLMGRSPYKKLFESDTTEDKTVALKALKSVGMDRYANRPYATLSGGEKQRVLIARSLAQGADVLILDEPTNHLDVHYQWALMELIKSLNKTVLSVFHELNLACTFCDYLFVLDQGKIIAQGKPSDICTAKLFEEVFRIKVNIVKDHYNVPHIIYERAIV